MPPAITDRQMSCITRAFSRYIQLRRWARASKPISWARRSASRSRAEKALLVQTLETAYTSQPPTRADCAAQRTEERRVGTECGSPCKTRRSAVHYKKNTQVKTENTQQ